MHRGPNLCCGLAVWYAFLPDAYPGDQAAAWRNEQMVSSPPH